MATSEDDAATATASEIELEAMRRDFSWHPCRVSLSYDGGGLLVEFENNISEKMQLRRDEVIVRLHVRSVPLEDYDCSLVRHGESVLVTLASSTESLFFDAVVEEVLRGRHSRNTNCRCYFQIKWLHLDHAKETFTLPAASVKKLSTKSIHAHQTVRACLESEYKQLPQFVPLDPNHSSTMDYELELSRVVKQHCEWIETLSGDNSRNNVLSQAQPAGSKAILSNYQAHCGLNNLRMSTQTFSRVNVNMNNKDYHTFY